jgi:zinc and cadmium transporter
VDYLLLLSSIALGAATFIWLRLQEPRHVKLLNAFTGAYLLSLTLLHLLPELYHVPDGKLGDPALRLGALILAGFFMQVALDVISLGVEHGHAHTIRGRLPAGVVLGLSLHALLEATSLGDAKTHFDPASRRLLLWSIVIHNYPVSIALLGMLLQSGLRRGRALLWLGVFAGMGPLGMFLSSHTMLALYSRELMAFVIGIFLHISTTILFESSDAHRFNFQKLAAIVLGIGFGILSLMVC